MRHIRVRHGKRQVAVEVEVEVEVGIVGWRSKRDQCEETSE